MQKAQKDNLIAINFVPKHLRSMKDLLASPFFNSQGIIKEDLVKKVFNKIKNSPGSFCIADLATLLYEKEEMNWDIFDRFVMKLFPQIMEHLRFLLELDLARTDKKYWPKIILEEYLANPKFRANIIDKQNRPKKLYDKLFDQPVKPRLRLIKNHKKK